MKINSFYGNNMVNIEAMHLKFAHITADWINYKDMFKNCKDGKFWDHGNVKEHVHKSKAQTVHR